VLVIQEEFMCPVKFIQTRVCGQVQNHTLLLIPGFACDARMWQRQTRELHDIVDCIVADVPESDDLTKIAEAVLEQCPEGEFSVCGASMGGYLAFELWQLAPERIRSMALLVTAPYLDSASSAKRRQSSIAVMRAGRGQSMWAAAVSRFVAPENRTNRTIVRNILAEVGVCSQTRFERHHKAMAARRDNVPILETITCPTLVISGRHDGIIDAATAFDFACQIPNARFVLLEKCGHMPTFEQPDLITDYLRQWLEQSSRRHRLERIQLEHQPVRREAG